MTTNTNPTCSASATPTAGSPGPPMTSGQPSNMQFLQNNQQYAAKHQAGVVITAPTHRRPQSSEPVLYPLASSGRGLRPTQRGILPQLPEHTVTVANPDARSIVAAYQNQQAPLFAPTEPPHSIHLIRPPFSHPSLAQMSSVSVVRGLQVDAHRLPAGSSPCVAPDNNHDKDSKDKVTDDTFFTVRDRKVRISDKSSIYALCRSWLRNGYPEESEPQDGDVLKSLPKPLPESSSPKRKERDDETEVNEDVRAAETSYAEELLQRHIKRAKRVRGRLREERLQRIERYKSRLALLLPPLPPPVDCRNDTCTGI